MKVNKRLALGASAIAGIAFALPAMATPNSPQGGNGTGVQCSDGTLSWTPTNLWPPNHKYVPIHISYSENSESSDGSQTAIAVTHVTEQDGTHPAQDATVAETLNGSGKPGQIDAQPHDGTGDPTMGSDTTAATFTEDIRAERSGTDGHGSGRTYTITVQCMDSGPEGSTDSADITVTVPHDQGVVKP